MKAAIMQPYLFPYIGYHQLLHSVDVFVIYDDVNYIKRGFVNRNSILLDGAPKRITVPVPGASQNKMFNELSFSPEVEAVLKTLRHAYGKAPGFSAWYPPIAEILVQEERRIPHLCHRALSLICEAGGMNPEIRYASSIDYNREGAAADRLIALCKELGADEYVNSIGGIKLYTKDYFEARGIELYFLETGPVRYRQPGEGFIPNLSIIDALMWATPAELRGALREYRLI